MSEKKEEHKGFEAPGTLVLVLIFLAWFVAMFVISWLGLARLWPVG